MKRLLVCMMIILLILTGCEYDLTPTVETAQPSPTGDLIATTEMVTKPATLTPTRLPTRTEVPPTATLTIAPTITMEPTFASKVTPSALAFELQQDIIELKALYNAQELPDDLITEGDPIIDPASLFDPNEVFGVLDHLNMKVGYKLAFIYRSDDLGGQPMLYALEDGETPFTSYDEYIASRPECSDPQRSSDCLALSKVEHDGSEMGYLQFITFAMMQEQFYLYWHANYNDFQPLTTPDRLETILMWIDPDWATMEYAAFTTFGDVGFSQEQKAAAREMDLEPKVTQEEDGANVRLLVYTKWGGFAEIKYWVPRVDSENIETLEVNVLVKYEIPLAF